MENKKIRIDEETKSITVVLGNKYWCAINVSKDFKDKVMECNSVEALNKLFDNWHYE